MKPWITAILAAALMCALPAAAQVADPVNGAAYPSTATNVTITTHLVFQNLLASSSSRKGCFIQNTSQDTEYVFFGALGSATAAKSIVLQPGTAVNCSSGVIVAADAVNITSANTDGATALVISQ